MSKPTSIEVTHALSITVDFGIQHESSCGHKSNKVILNADVTNTTKDIEEVMKTLVQKVSLSMES